MLNVEAEQDTVPIGNDILLAFRTHQPPVTGDGFRPTGNVIIIGDDFSANKTALEIRNNFV